MNSQNSPAHGTLALPPIADALDSLLPAEYRELARQRTLVMGILNVTPDSFSDGGRYFAVDAAVAQARRLVEEGADLLDVGGQSTRPGSLPVEEAEEARRVLPVIAAVVAELPAPVSIDTTRAGVAREAVRLGARMINDISGLRFDPEIARVAAESGAWLALMHSRGTPRDMQSVTDYTDLVGEVTAFLGRQAAAAVSAGVARDRIVIDPGLGFAKTAGQNLDLLRRGRDLLGLGFPILVGTSRKSFIGRILDGAPPDDRMEGTAATVALAIAGGARIVRVHDVKVMVRVARVADAICRPDSGLL